MPIYSENLEKDKVSEMSLIKTIRLPVPDAIKNLKQIYPPEVFAAIDIENMLNEAIPISETLYAGGDDVVDRVTKMGIDAIARSILDPVVFNSIDQNILFEAVLNTAKELLTLTILEGCIWNYKCISLTPNKHLSDIKVFDYL